MSFLNKVVFITGAGSGIGEATALKLAKLSARLSLVDINEEALKKTAVQCEKISKVKVLAITADLTKDNEVKDAVEKTVKQYGRLDVVVNSAGIMGPGGILDEKLLEKYDKVMEVNIRSIISVIHFSAPALIESKGSIINISSCGAELAVANIPYSVSKAVLNNFTKNVAAELAPKGVRVNSISPGAVKTNILDNAGLGKESIDAYFKTWYDAVPLKQAVKLDDISELITYLASDKAQSITGVNYKIDSGASLSNKNEEITKVGIV